MIFFDDLWLISLNKESFDGSDSKSCRIYGLRIRWVWKLLNGFRNTGPSLLVLLFVFWYDLMSEFSAIWTLSLIPCIIVCDGRLNDFFQNSRIHSDGKIFGPKLCSNTLCNCVFHWINLFFNLKSNTSIIDNTSTLIHCLEQSSCIGNDLEACIATAAWIKKAEKQLLGC